MYLRAKEIRLIKIIIGGDFNLFINPALDKDKNAKSTDVSERMRNLIDEFLLIDIWQTKNQELKRYTWRRNKSLVQSRLDYWFILFELSFMVESTKIVPGLKADHSMITLVLKFSNSSNNGPGLWKFNSDLLKYEDYCDGIKYMYILKTETDIEEMEQK